MKKIIILLLTVFVAASSFAELYDPNELQNYSKSKAEEEFKPFAQVMAQALNGGLGDVMNVGTVKIGAEMVVIPFEKEGLLSQASVSFLPMPYVYGGVNLFGVTLFGRGMILPVESGGNYPVLWGLGAGYEFSFTPLFTVLPAITYHRIEGLDQIDVNSLGGQIQARVNLMMLTLFANVGVSYTDYATELEYGGVGSGQTLEYTTTLLQTSVGLKLAMFFVEVGFTPEMAYSFGASIGF
jgi:hypothetical protein